MRGNPDPVADAPLSATYDAVLTDLDGTLIRGSEAIPGAAEALVDAGLPVVYVTNNASKSPAVAAEHLRGLGFDARAEDVMTSAQAAVVMLGGHLPVGSAVLVVGHPSFAELARQAGYRTVNGADEDPQAVLQGLSRELCWSDLAEGCLALRDGALWIASNVDTTLPTERGLMPGNGSLVACLEAATGRRPLVAGKPAPGVLRAAADRVSAERPIVVGDRLDTDIQGAVAAGMPALMVLTGVSGVSDLVDAPVEQRPTHLAEDLGAHYRLGREHLEVVGALVGEGVLRDADPERRGQLLQGGLPVEGRPHPRRGRHERVEPVVDQRRRGVRAAGQVDRADHGLGRVREDRGLVATPGALLAASEQQVGPEVETARDVGEGSHVDDGGAQLGQLALGLVGVGAIEGVGDDEPQHRVAQELQALVVGQAAVLVGVRPVRQGTRQQRLVDALSDHLREVVDEGADGPLLRTLRTGRGA